MHNAVGFIILLVIRNVENVLGLRPLGGVPFSCLTKAVTTTPGAKLASGFINSNSEGVHYEHNRHFDGHCKISISA